jgi:hypothetical protein
MFIYYNGSWTVGAGAAILWLSGCAVFPTPHELENPSALAAKVSQSAPAAAAAWISTTANPVAPGTVLPSAPPTLVTPSPFTPARADVPSNLKAFSEITKGATRQDGFIPLWRKDEKVWMEVLPQQWDKSFLFTVNIASSVGEKGLYASQMGLSWLTQFRRISASQAQLIAVNTDFVANNPALKSAVEQGFSNSLLAALAVVSAPHPERQSVLIDATFLMNDLPMYSTRIEAAFRLPFTLDRANSYFEKTRVASDLTTLNTRMHFAVPRLPVFSGVSGNTLPSPPSTPPDPRSFFVGYVYNLLKLPEKAMAVRKADPRLGHFTTAITDLSTDVKPNAREHFINRWRLEKADPQAALSEPKKPIVYWLDKNIPSIYRSAVEAGVLEWNKAFERIGFKNAIQVKQQPEDADWDTMDAKHASIRWLVGSDVGVAVGPSQADPRTGEIFDADIAMSDVFGRGARRFWIEDMHAKDESFASATTPWRQWANAFASCEYAREAVAEMDFALDVLEARGEIASHTSADGPEIDKFVQAVIKDTIMHEVGHTLGLKHNFKASTVVSPTKLRDKNFTETQGISGSVMDYNAFNLPLKGEQVASFNTTTLGPYDYWAIEYAYAPLKSSDALGQTHELEQIAARSSDPLLAYADDAETGGFGANDGIDPLVNRFDLGSDPLAYYQRRLKLSQELWDRVQARAPQPGDDPQRKRRSLLSGFRQLTRAADLAGKYVGGLYTVRDLPGTSTRRAFTPVPPAKQRQALDFLTRGLFAADSFRFQPQFLTSLPPDYLEWERAGPVSVPNAVLQMQSQALNRLMSPGTANRLLELPYYYQVSNNKDVPLISLSEVYETLQQNIWSELKSGRDIELLRRNLQREHLKRTQTLLLRSTSALPADALSLIRFHSIALQKSLQQALKNKRLSIEAQAHLQDSLALLTEALRATMQRS